MISKDDFDRLQQIKEEMQSLLFEAKYIVKSNTSQEQYQQAQNYWIKSLEVALSEPKFSILPFTLADTIENLKLSAVEYLDSSELTEEDNY